MKTKIEKPKSRNQNSSPFFNSKNEAAFFNAQAKLKVGNPGDKYEVEADRVAEEVVNSQSNNQPFFAAPQTQLIQQKPIAESITPLVQFQEEEEEELQTKLLDSTVQRQEEEEEELQMQPEEEEEEIQMQEEEEEEEILQPKSDSPVTDTHATTEQKLNGSKGNGSSLDSETRVQMESSFGANFSGVKIHTDSTAVQLNKELGAQAFTTGNDIYFNEGRYQPDSQNGKKLLAHELTHTVQQRGEKNRTDLNRKVQPTLKISNSDRNIQLVTDEDFLHTSDIQLMQCVSHFNNLYHLSSNYSIASRNIGDTVRNKYLGESRKYNTAFMLYSQTIANARAEARNQNQWTGIVVGIAAGIGLGLLAAWLLPAAAAGAATITLGEAVAAGTSAFVQAGVGTLFTSGVSNLLATPGSDLQPTGLSPEVVRTSIWRKAAEIYRGGLSEVHTQQTLHSLSMMALETRRQVQQKLNRQDTRLSLPLMHSLVPCLYRARTRTFSLNTLYEQKLQQQESILNQINSYSGPDSREMEKGIWILWISRLPTSDSDMLDLDAIENHLNNLGIIGAPSVLGVDFGRWTSKEDETNAIFAAIPHAARIRRLFNNLQAGNVNTLTSSTPFSTF